MPALPVSLDRESVVTRIVRPRTFTLVKGTVCEVVVEDDCVCLCVVEGINNDGSVAARRLSTKTDPG